MDGEMNETQLKNKVIRLLKSKYPDMWFYKSSDRFTSGIPDILCCFMGHFIAIELKTPAGRITPLQSHTLEKICDAGGISKVCRSVQEVDSLLMNIMMLNT